MKSWSSSLKMSHHKFVSAKVSLFMLEVSKSLNRLYYFTDSNYYPCNDLLMYFIILADLCSYWDICSIASFVIQVKEPSTSLST